MTVQRNKGREGRGRRKSVSGRQECEKGKGESEGGKQVCKSKPVMVSNTLCPAVHILGT